MIAPANLRRGRPRRRGARGFTLLELVVALALFALVSIMALQMLTGALHQSRLLARTDARAAEVLRVMTLLRRDLERLVPVPFQSPLGEVEPAYAPVLDRLSLSTGGQSRLPRTGPDSAGEAGFRRVIWRHDAEAGTLTRRAWGVLNPRDAEQIGAETVQLTGVLDLRVTPGPAPEDETEAEAAPPARIEVEIETAHTGTLRVVVSRW